MKKIIIVLILLTTIYIIFNKKDYVICTKKSMNQDYTISTNYKIYYKNKEVYKIELNENIEAKTTSTLNKVMENIEKSYNQYKNEIGSYDYKITKNKTKGKTKVIIDYDKMNMENYLKYNPDANLNENKKYNIDTLKKMYEERGAKCK